MDTQTNPGQAGPSRVLASRPRARQILVLALAASAGLHAALVPAHAADTAVAAGFALSALALAIVALLVDRSDRPGSVVTAALLLASLLSAYAATRVAAVWPLTHAEPVDAIGAVTKLIETAGLVLAVRLVKAQAGGSKLPARYEGVGP